MALTVLRLSTSHDFWFNKDEHDKMSHYAQPCMYTDYRYTEGRDNFYGKC